MCLVAVKDRTFGSGAADKVDMTSKIRGMWVIWLVGWGLAGVGRAQQVTRYAAIFEKVSGPAWAARHGMTSAEYQSEFNSLVGQGYRVIHVNGYTVNGVDYYSAIWDKSPMGAWQARHRISSADYQSAVETLGAQGYRPVHVSGYSVGGVDNYAAIWIKDSSVTWAARHRLTASAYQTAFNDLAGQGYRLAVVSGYSADGAPAYAAIWVKTNGPAWTARHGVNADQYQATFTELTGKGYRPRWVNGYDVDGDARYTAAWDKGTGEAWVTRLGLSATEYQATFNTFVGQGYRPVVVSGYAIGSTVVPDLPTAGVPVASLKAFDDAMKGFMGARQVPAGVLCVSKDGKILLERAYGWGNVAKNSALSPTALFRIASLCKPLTEAAVRALVTAGKLNLGDFVFDLGQPGGGRLKLTPVGVPDSRLKLITIDHLMNHTGGWDRDVSGDPMFQSIQIAQALGKPSPPTQVDIARCMMGRPLDHDPGARHAYSNFGYLLLGLIIEQVTGMDYVRYVNDAILGPAGVPAGEVSLGRSLPALRNPREPEVYYDPGTAKNVFNPSATVPFADGGFHLEVMEAHGGLISSARAYARFLMRYWIDGNPRGANGPSYTFFGSLPGSTTVAHQRSDGVNLVAFFNQRTDPSGLSYNDILPLLNGAADSIAVWPTSDVAAEVPARPKVF